jgi:hypothetical protein
MSRAECEICGAEADGLDVFGHETCSMCDDVIADNVHRLFRDPVALQAIREQVAAIQRAYEERR